MKRLFILFSIFMLLGSNFAIAVDYDCLASVDELSTLSQDQNNEPDNNDNNDNIDHGCHSVSHFVAIYPDTISKASILSNSFKVNPISIPKSTYFQPITPPPNV